MRVGRAGSEDIARAVHAGDCDGARGSGEVSVVNVGKLSWME